MNIKGYYLEALYPRFAIYRILIINFVGSFESYNVAINLGQHIEDYYPSYTDLGGMI